MRTQQLLVSVIVTTRNNHETLEACLHSIAEQSYSPIELIVVDNNSTDDTKDIARRHTNKLSNLGPERSAQRNFGVAQAAGEYVLIIDSDMILTHGVVAACVDMVQREAGVRAIVIPEESFGTGFWARCKRLERSFYAGLDTVEAARFFERHLYDQVDGYNEAMTGGEDWDLTRRVRLVWGVTIGRVTPLILHNEGHPRFVPSLRRMYRYAHAATVFFANNPTKSALIDRSGPLARYKLFFSHPKKLFRDPALGAGMLTLKTAEFAAAGLGYVHAKYLAKKKHAKARI